MQQLVQVHFKDCQWPVLSNHGKTQYWEGDGYVLKVINIVTAPISFLLWVPALQEARTIPVKDCVAIHWKES